MGELGRAAVVSRTRASRVVSELEQHGLAERTGNTEDGRSAVAVITAEGRARLRRAAPVYLAAVDREFTSHLGRDAAAVARALERVVSG
jgi:DNA-binding MarR family transcriptional regulator